MNRLPEKIQPTLDLTGLLLVAAPRVENPLFANAVCLVVSHGSDGSSGIVLNRPFSATDHEIGNLLKNELGLSNDRLELHFGGPFSGPVVAIHDQPEFAEAGNDQGVYLAANSELLNKLAVCTQSKQDSHYRIFLGRMGWKPGELEASLRNETWSLMPSLPDVVFAPQYEMWGRARHWVGRSITQCVLGLPYLPASPLLN